MRELLDPEIMAQFEREAQRLDPDRRARGLEGVADLLRMLGPLDAAEVAARLKRPASISSPRASRATSSSSGRSSAAGCRGRAHRASAPAAAHLAELIDTRRAIPVTIAGVARVAAIEDAGRLRDVLRCAAGRHPERVPRAARRPARRPRRPLRPHPWTVHERRCRRAAGRRHRGRASDAAAPRVQRRSSSGFFLPTSTSTSDETEWCDAEVLRRLRMRSLAAIRGSVEPVSPEAFARFLPVWQHISRPLDGIDGVAAVIEQLAGVPIPASAWESLRSRRARTLLHPGDARRGRPRPARSSWSGHGALPGRDGWIALHPAYAAPLTLLLPDEIASVCSSRISSGRSRTAARTSPRSCANSPMPRTSLRRGGAVEPHVGRARHERHVRPGADAARRRLAGASHRAQGATGPDVSRSLGGTREHPAAAAGDRRTLVAAATP